VELEVNGQKGTFLIDTGAWELHLTPAFADKCGIQRLAETQTAVFAGGLKAASANAVADRVRLGEFTLRNVPVVIPIGPGGRPVDGIIGTVVLGHFIFSLDYPNGQLVLRRNTQEMSRAVRADADSTGAIRMPFWLAGTHFMYAWGTANGAGPYLFLIDTGMGGGGFDCPDSVIREAKIELPKEGFTGMGGGGEVTVYPFAVDLTLGDAREANVQGLHGAVPPGSEERFGFRTGGLISHAFFRSYVVTFDFGSMVLYMKRAAR
jgi:predicted aspartyl protease